MKNILILLLFIVFTLCVINCESDSDGDEKEGAGSGWCDKELSESEASAINVQLLQEITGMYNAVSQSAAYPDYSDESGSVVVDGEYTTYPYYFKFDFEFNGYVGTCLSINSGRVTYIDKVDDMSSIHYWQYKDGYFNITVSGEDYEVWWDFETYNSAGQQFTDGTFRICQSEFNYE